MKAEKARSGADIIDLGVGDPDLPTPPHVVEALCAAARDPANHHYPSYAGMPAFREAVAGWYGRRFGVDLDPGTEVLALMGSKDGIAHVPEAFVNPGDIVLAPSPGYPVYRTSTLFAEGVLHELPLTAGNGFLPDLDAIPADVARRAKLLFVNYPNNPTSAVAPPSFYDEVVAFAREHEIVVVSDNAYSGDRLRRLPRPLVPRDRRRHGGRGRDALALEDLQHDRLADRDGRREPRDPRRARTGQDERGLRGLRRGPARRHRGPLGLAGLRRRRLPGLRGAARRARAGPPVARVRRRGPEGDLLRLAPGRGLDGLRGPAPRRGRDRRDPRRRLRRPRRGLRPVRPDPPGRADPRRPSPAWRRSS